MLELGLASDMKLHVALVTAMVVASVNTLVRGTDSALDMRLHATLETTSVEASKDMSAQELDFRSPAVLETLSGGTLGGMWTLELDPTMDTR